MTVSELSLILSCLKGLTQAQQTSETKYYSLNECACVDLPQTLSVQNKEP